MKLVMPHAGYGLGNDLIPWAKGYILSRELSAKLLHPAWGNNRREYSRYFDTFRWDWQLYRILVRVLPKYAFEEKDYCEIGENDFVLSCRRFAEIYGLYKKKAYIITITGRWGAYSGLESARNFILGELYKTRFTRDNLFTIANKRYPDKISIGIHIRRGDFWQLDGNKYEGIYNTALPLEWYTKVCRSLTNIFGRDKIQILLATDGSREEVNPILQEFPCLLISELENSVCSDLISLSEVDLLICSISTYSMCAAFLSKSPYIWFKPHLSSFNNAFYIKNIRLLGIFNEPHVDSNSSKVLRGVPVGLDGKIPDFLVTYLQQVMEMKQSNTDLIRGGICKS
jgi:hypothetical protein